MPTLDGIRRDWERGAFQCDAFNGFNGGGWELSPKNTFLHVGWMGGTPFHAYDKAANQDMYDFIILMLWPNVWKRASVPKYLDTCHLYCCAKEYIVARSINAHVLYGRERERI